MSTLFSGGATGADSIFTEMAIKAGHNVVNYSFEGHKSSCPGIIELPQTYLNKADVLLRYVNETYLNRKFPTDSLHVNNLLRRNYYQVISSKIIYAVSYYSNFNKKIVNGGTAWAISMALVKKVPVYFYDINFDSWFLNNEEIDYIPPKPKGNYAGIGKRNLTKNGINAIINLYI